jgi:acyl dehydratase
MAMDNSAPERVGLYLDDLTVGQEFVTASHEVDAQQIKTFAAQFDPQPFHLDEEAAKGTVFGRLVASGWLTMGITMRLLVQSGLPLAGGIVGLGATVTWPRPTYPGDVLTVHGKVTEITPSRSKPDRGTIGVYAETRNQRGEVAQTFTSTLVLPRRTDAAGA